ncbi:MBOAT family O-acyltransferase [Mangrovimonas cancribranchiae]|uniref:MBOAT family O-acyltransferase n=1 Tax=Mangrovimonas cancribranchiae TaxID=3080055 RepID=A0AAU6PA97_9FLAO
MLFNSIEYLIFLPTVFVLYWLLNKDHKKQNVLLLISSYIFYAFWDWRFLSLIVYSSLIDYFVGLKIHESSNKTTRKNWLILSLVSNLGLLAVFKYYNFFAESFAALMSVFGWQVDNVTLNIILPIGISFYTFQTLSYTIDIYRKDFKPTKNVVAFFTYVSFFPQLVAGPIERAAKLLPQIEKSRTFNKKWFHDGIFQITVGLFRKIVIADNLAHYVNPIYADPELHNSSTLVLATTFFAFQIYFDFAGYSDIAIGSAKLLGFKFTRNFNLPYFSKSLSEVWRRWHISLSTWLRDYLYKSLGSNKGGKLMMYKNVLITMVLGGLWHGNTWNFVIWGLMQGILLGVEKFIFVKLKIRNAGVIGYIITFTVILTTWAFFRAPTFESAKYIIKKFIFFDFRIPHIGDANAITTGVIVFGIGMLFDLYLYKSRKSLETLGSTFGSFKLSLFISIAIILMALFYSTSNNFIYFQF